MVFLVDLFSHLNKLKVINVKFTRITSNKLGRRKRRIKDKNLDMSPLVPKTKHTSAILEVIFKTLTKLKENHQHYFRSLNINEYYWIRDPFLVVFEFLVEEEEEYAEINEI